MNSSTQFSTKPPNGATFTSPVTMKLDIAKSTSKPSTCKSNNVSHVVRVTVLGLAGITVNQNKCNEYSNEIPTPPSKMRAVVAFSQNTTIQGITSLSKPLVPSPNDHTIKTASSIKNSNGKYYKETYKTNTVQLNRPERHVAVWASDNATLGSAVTFDANFQQSSSSTISNASSGFAPKSFELTIALTDNDNHDTVALPVGIATVTIRGDECIFGQSITLDLPVLNIQDAKPRSNQGYPMIAIARNEDEPQQKKKLVQRLFVRNGSKVPNPPKYPSMAARNAFWSTYSIDEEGDAILRISIEVYEKGSVLERHFVSRHAMDGTLLTSSLSTLSPLTQQKNNKRDAPYNQDQANCFLPNSAARRGNWSHYRDHDKYDLPSDEEVGSDLLHVDPKTSSAAHSNSHKGIANLVKIHVENRDFSHWKGKRITLDEEQTTDTDTDQYTLSFEKKPPVKSAVPNDDKSIRSFSMFGNSYRIPSCGAIPILDESSSMLQDIQDDMTVVTADFFGKSYKVPMCATFLPKDDETLTTLDQTITDRRDPRLTFIINKFSEKFCRGMAPSDELDLSIVGTFSTLSEGLRTQELKEGAFTTDYLKWDGKTDRVFKPATQSSSKRFMNIVSYEAPRHQAKDDREESQTAGNDDMLERYRFEQDSAEKRSSSDVSPKGVSELIPNFDLHRKNTCDTNKSSHGGGYANLVAMVESPPPRKRRPARSKSFVDFFNCHPTDFVNALRNEPYQREVPPLINLFPTDEMSIGELTCTTHEMNIATEAKLLENARKVYNNVERPVRKKASRTTLPFPVAFGGDGSCLGMGMSGCSTASSPFQDGSDDENSLVMKPKKSKRTTVSKIEEYYANYDEYLNLSSGSSKKRAEVNQFATSHRKVARHPVIH